MRSLRLARHWEPVHPSGGRMLEVCDTERTLETVDQMP